MSDRIATIMKSFLVLFFSVICLASAIHAQTAESNSVASPSPSAVAADVESLRHEVQALTETVKALQQQVKDQQSAMEKMNAGAPSLPQNPEKETAAASASPSSRPAASAPTLFPTTDTGVIASAPASAPTVNHNGDALPTGFPTTDSSVTSSRGGEGGLAAPITIGGGKNYMNM